MTELNFQRGKSFEEVSRALTDSSVGTEERSNLHAAEAHPAASAEVVDEAQTGEPQNGEPSGDANGAPESKRRRTKSPKETPAQ